MGNGEEYYHLELVCKDDTEYGIQAYGEEAKALYREVKESSRTNNVAEEQSPLQSDLHIKEDQENSNLLKRELDYMTSFSFEDKNGYYLVFKKLKDVCISRKKKITRDLQ
jgi:Skp family chaperone for outer membrane proteins